MVSDAQIEAAVSQLRAGGLVAFATETVYGLGADATNEAALRRLFATKGRPADHPVIVHIASVECLAAWARNIPEAARKLAERFWPGPLTLILQRQPNVSLLVTGGQDSVGLRSPSHPVAQQLLAAFDGALAAPSANRYGHVSPTSAQHVREEFSGGEVLILDGGPCAIGIESTIVGFDNGRPRVLRPGSISAAQIEAAVGGPLATGLTRAPRVPGSVERHYAPRTPAEWVESTQLAARAAHCRAAGSRVAILSCDDKADSAAEDYARNLYARLRQLDSEGAERILIEAVPSTSAWVAVSDRLRRASGTGA